MNPYIKLIKEISHDNKYTTWYVNIISYSLDRCKCKNEAKIKLGKFISHHILPKSFKLGGEKDKLNLVFLTIREHFLVHILLPKMIKNKTNSFKISSAITKMNYDKKLNSRTYETGLSIQSKFSVNKLEEKQTKTKQTLKLKYNIEHNSQLPSHKEKVKTTNNINFGYDWASQSPKCKERSIQTNLEKYKVTHSSKLQKTQEKKKETNLKTRGVEHVSQDPLIKQKKKETNLKTRGVENVSQDPTLKQKISESIKQSWKTREYIYCPHCDKTSINKARMTQYHFDNCKLSPLYIPPKELKCTHCSKNGKDTIQFKTNHFDNCKLK
jgi:hypothetical protein